MIRLLVIAEHAHAAESLKVLLPATHYRLVHLPSAEQAAESLPPAFIDGCLLDASPADVTGLRHIETIRGLFPDRPLFVCADAAAREWEEAAYVKGAAFVFHRPLRSPLLASVLGRFFSPAADAPAAATAAAPVSRPPAAAPAPAASLATLETIRDFSRLLSHSFNFKSFLHEFVLKLREVISVNRIAIFLRRPANPFLPARPEDARRLACACSVGVAAELYQFFELSLDTGIGAIVSQSGQILKAAADSQAPLARAAEAQREFEILGGQFAVPILDRERLLGISVFGGGLTGLRLSDEELQLLFHLMEELGLALKNSWLHDQLAAHHDLLAGVMTQMSGGCLVVARDLTVLQANPAFLQLFGLATAGRPLEFAHLPQKLSSAIYEVLSDAAREHVFHYHRDDRVIRVAITPFRLGEAAAPSAALVSAEDHTQIEAARKNEVAQENRRLLSLIAEKFSHEIRNALVPINTHRQLLATDYERADFRASLQQTLDKETLRILRCSDQLFFLSRPKNEPIENHSLLHLLQEAVGKAAEFTGGQPGAEFKSGPPDCLVLCEPLSLRHAFFEVILNALQARPEAPAVTFKGRLDKAEGRSRVLIGIGDPGPGFTADAATAAFRPFCTTRSVGIGLGLSVAQKIIRDHGGVIEVFPRPKATLGDIVITLPVS